MYNFTDWLNNKRLKENMNDEENFVDKYKFNDQDADYADDHDKVKKDLFDVAIKKYPEETLDFFHTLAQRGDNEIVVMLRKIDKNHFLRLGKKPEHPEEKEEVKPPEADSGFGGDA
jgi:hypothetical protein